MRSAIDATRQTRDDHQVMLAKVVSQPSCEPAGRCRRVARADDCHGQPIQQVEIAPDDQQRRRVFGFSEQSRIQSLSEDQISRPKLLYARNLALGVAPFDEPRSLSPASPREVGHRLERRRRVAEAAHQLAESDPPYSGCSNQPQPVDEIFVQALALPMRGSVPAFRRRMFSRCFQRISNAKPSSIGKSGE